jgi:hypothetical protein
VTRSAEDRAGEIVGRGRTSVVYAIGTDRVIKIYPEGTDPAEVRAEEHAAGLIHRLGVPGVRCYGSSELDGRPGIVFERLTGDSLTTIAERDLRRFPQVCRTLAEYHARMHRARTEDLPDVRRVAAGLLDSPPLAGLTGSQRQALRRYLEDLPDGDRVLHLDFHPQNVFGHLDGYAIIDWYSACRGAAAADVAMSILLMSEAELWPGTPPLKKLLYLASRAAMRRLYWRRYRGVTGMAHDDVARWLTCARILRLGLLDVPSERHRLLRRIRAAAVAQ